MKKIGLLIMALVMVLSMGLFTGCGDSNDVVVVPEGATEYIYEAEDTDLTSYMGTMYSSARSGYSAVSSASTSNVTETAINSVSGGYFVSCFNAATETIEFIFEADEASSGNGLYICMGSEFGTLTVTPENIRITVNGTVLDYDDIRVKGEYESEMGGTYTQAFTQAELPNIDIVEGENTIYVEVIEAAYGGNSKLTGQPHGPGIDCIKIVSESTLTWETLYDKYRN